MNSFNFYRKQINILFFITTILLLVFAMSWINGKDIQNVQSVECDVNEVVKGEELSIFPEESFCTENIEISIVFDSEAANAGERDIYYSLDGSIPTLDSERYTEPLHIESTEEMQVIVVRASTIKDGELTEPITRTYFVGEDIDSRFSTNVVSIVTDEENLYGYEKGILVRGKVYDDWLASGGSEDALPWYIRPANYNQRTDEWIREAHVEVFAKDGARLVDIDAGISVAGTATSSYPIKSINIKADEKYDEQTEYYNFVEAESEILNEAFSHVGETTNSVRLRNSGNDLYGTLIRQNVCNELALQSGLRTVSIVSPTVTFINGEYYALLQAQNNFSPSNLEKMLSIESKDIVKMEEGEKYIFSSLNKEIDFSTADFNDPYIREEFEKLVDLDEFFLYYAIQTVIDNGDWPNNNYKVVKYTGEQLEGNRYSDGKIHFLFFGSEFAFQLDPDRTDVFKTFFDPESADGTTYIINNMMNYPPYKHAFVNQICDLLATSFKADNVVSLFDKYYEQIEDELPYLANASEELCEIEGGISNGVEDAREKAYERITYIIPEYLCQFLEAAEPYQLTVEVPEGRGEIWCNTLVIDENTKAPLNGTYFRNYPVQIMAVEKDGYEFSHFEVNGEIFSGNTITVTPEMIVNDQLCVEACFEETVGEKPTITAVSSEGDNDWIELTNFYLNDIDLNEFYLSDSKGTLWKYQCPNVTLEQGESIRILGKRNPENSEYRMSFALKGMETIYLSDNKGDIIEYYFIEK